MVTFTSNKNVPLMIFTAACMEFEHIKQTALFMSITNVIIIIIIIIIIILIILEKSA